jgi:hypothetical protein
VSVGTRSVLFGVHAFWLHPFFTAEAWRQIYGFPWDVRLWVAFFVHDLGYWNKNNMEGPEGETHVYVGARILSWLFGNAWGEFYKLCGIQEYFKSFLRAAADGGRGKRAASPSPGQQCRS